VCCLRRGATPTCSGGADGDDPMLAAGDRTEMPTQGVLQLCDNSRQMFHYTAHTLRFDAFATPASMMAHAAQPAKVE